MGAIGCNTLERVPVTDVTDVTTVGISMVLLTQTLP